jgi:DNA polymerase-1
LLTQRHTVAGTDCLIHTPENRRDLEGFFDFLRKNDRVLGLDSETTGLNIFSPGFGLRLVQFGNDREAWVLRADLFRDAIRDTLLSDRLFAVHNAPFDLLVFDKHLDVRVEALAPRVFDTRIFAHLIDPRQESEGGAGLSLKPLSAIYVDPDAPDTQAGLYAEFRKIGKTKDTGWAAIDIMNPLYNRYAGLDVIFETRLFHELSSVIKGIGLSRLSKFEHLFASYIMLLQRKGMLVDLDYAENLDTELSAEAVEWRAKAAKYGVENTNSTSQIAEALVGMGVDLKERTPSGALKVDKGVLLPLADLDPTWKELGLGTANPLAVAVLHAKRAEKWRVAYIDAFRTRADSEGRIHPNIGTLQARTARMSVSNPPLQQLPSKDWKVRRAILADRGQVMMSADYDQVEFRVLAALADVKGMKTAIAEGIDLHDFTAEMLYGPEFTKFQRSLSKGVGFGKVFGGGAPTLSRQTGAPIAQVREAIAKYDSVYPEIKKFGRMLQRKAEYGKREVVTVSGRHLPLDKDRLYSATNYVVQSTARDVIAESIVDMFDAGLGDYLIMPIHDEVLFQAPTADADEVGREIGKVMSKPFMGVPLTASADVYGMSWGNGYGCSADKSDKGYCEVTSPHPQPAWGGLKHRSVVPNV